MSLTRLRTLSAISCLILAACTLFPVSRLAAQAGGITGRITHAATGEPMENVEVRATGAQVYGAISGADGSYQLRNLPTGLYTLLFRRIGFEPQTISGVAVGGVVDVKLAVATAKLDAMVVTASRARPEKALDAPAQISVVTSERIAERPAVTITDHLRGVPGVDINRGGIAQANIVSRGFNNAFSGAMLMLQDYRFAGVPSLRVNVPFMFTGTNEDIDRMEVLLGPASALYGPNSSSGVLHVITKSPFSSLGTTVSVDGGERSVLRAGIRHAGQVNEYLAFKLSGEYMQGKDWQYNDRAEPTKFPSGSNVPEPRRGKDNVRNFDLQRYTSEARMDIRTRNGIEAISTAGFTKIGSGIELTGANGSVQVKDWTYTSLQQRFNWNRFFAQAFMNLSNAGNDTSTSANGTFLLRSGQPIVDKSTVLALQAQHGFDLGSKQSFTYGVDYIRTNPSTGGTINGANEDIDNVREVGAYVQSSTKPIKQVEFLFAARGDQNNVIDGKFFSPRAALILKPTENQNIRFTFNRAFSTPANFSFFLDLIQAPNAGGSGFDIIARGNPPKQGWQYNRSCASNSAFGSYCMRSRLAGGGSFVGASAASAFPGLVQGNSAALTAAIAGGLQANGVPASFASNFATSAVQYLGTRTPTNTDIATRISYITSATVPLTTDQLPDIKPLSASYNQTYEVGYKAIVNNKVRFDVSYWGQDRGDVATTGAVATPNVWFGNPTQLGGYIGARLEENLKPNLSSIGLTPAQINALITGIANSLTGSLAPAPLGVVTFDDPNTKNNQVLATYQRVNKKLWVSGVDLAVDMAVTDRVTVETNYSFQNKNIWEDIIVGGIPFMSNSPKSRGSVGGRYRDEQSGLGFELRGRYANAYPVNSGVYSTNTAYTIAAGNPGATPTTPSGTGYNKCNPAANGTFCYEEVPEAFTFDAQVSKRFTVGAQKVNFTLSGTNLGDNRVRTFPGVPEIGRMIMTRLQFQF